MSVKIATLLYAAITGDMITGNLISGIHRIACACKESRKEKLMRERVMQSIRDRDAIKNQLDKMVQESGLKNSKHKEA